MQFSIDKLIADDWEQVRSIYMEGIETGNATFESEAPDWDNWHSSHMQECCLAARAGNTILGWAALSPVSSRCVYSGVAEVMHRTTNGVDADAVNILLGAIKCAVGDYTGMYLATDLRSKRHLVRNGTTRRPKKKRPIVLMLL